MGIKEQLYRIYKAAPYLPVQTVNGLALIVGALFLAYNGLDKLTTDYVKTFAQFAETGKIQERIREKEKEYFFKVFYTYNVDSALYPLANERGFRSVKQAEASKKSIDKYRKEIEIWFDRADPKQYETHNIDRDWLLPFMIVGFSILLPLMYFRWLLLKYYELEIEEI